MVLLIGGIGMVLVRLFDNMICDMILSVNFLVFTHAFVKFHKAPIKTLKLLVVQ
jgi:hypothetical protein